MVPLVSFEEATTQIGQLPKLLPLPTVTNIQVLVMALTKRLGNITSHQSEDCGFIGIFEQGPTSTPSPEPTLGQTMSTQGSTALVSTSPSPPSDSVMLQNCTQPTR